MKLLISSLLCVFLAPSLLGQSLSDLNFGSADGFRAITWNLEWFPKNGQSTLDSVATAVLALDADVYALQEISDTAQFMDWAETIPGFDGLHTDAWFGGLTYLVKTATVQVNDLYEILDAYEYWHPLPRSPLVLELTFNGHALVLINNHFKCCGDGMLDLYDEGDEENRRLVASGLIKDYVDANLSNERVMVMGDLNDILTDTPAHNVFQMFLNDPAHYAFADADVATGPNTGWSFPNWPSHIDHILVNNNWFEQDAFTTEGVMSIPVEDYLPGGWSDYDENMSDHRPVGISVPVAMNLSELESNADCANWSDDCRDVLGRRLTLERARQASGVFFRKCEDTHRFKAFFVQQP